MRLRTFDRLLVAALFTFAVSGTAAAVGPEPNPTTTQTKPAPKQEAPKSTGSEKKNQKKKKQSQIEFNDGFRVAYDLVYTKQDYASGIAQLKSLKQDDHPDVANLLGYASRKLGNYDASKYWYERALAADPRHARTLSYYGMWHAEQGNLLKAGDFLARVATICGTECREYTELKGVIEGTRSY